MKTFVQPPTITNVLIEDLKAGREEFLPGQWMISKKIGYRKLKYLGVYHLPDDGVVIPIVKFSYPKTKEHILEWNKRFKQEKDDLEAREVQYLARYPKLNERVSFTREKPEVKQILIDPHSLPDEVLELTDEYRLPKEENNLVEKPVTFFSNVIKFLGLKK